MDVSQLCNDSLEQIPDNSNKRNSSDSSRKKTTRTGKRSNLKFILSPYEKPPVKDKKEDLISIEQIFSQCSTLCENIWRLKVKHKNSTENEIEDMIEMLSKSASNLFKGIQSTKNWMSKTDLNKIIETYIIKTTNDYDFEEDDKDEDDELDELEDSASTTIKDHQEYKLIRQARNIQDNQLGPKYRKRNRRNMFGQKCHSCGTTETPEWRRGPDGARTLCNACGLHYSKLLKKGSITVQTHNYMLENENENEGILKIFPSSSNNLVEKASLNDPIHNFPFEMLSKKYRIEKNVPLLPTPNSVDGNINNDYNSVNNDISNGKALSFQFREWKKTN